MKVEVEREGKRTPPFVAAGFWLGGNLHGKANHASKLVLTSHERIATVKARAQGAWRYMARQFSVRGFVRAADATYCFSSVRTVTEGNATVA